MGVRIAVVEFVRLAVAVACLIAGRVSHAGFYDTAFAIRPTPQALTLLGRRLFFEPALSASGRMSCASCHSAQHAFGPPNALPVQRGGPRLRSPGLRAVPSLTYRAFTPAFDLHFRDTDGDDSIDQGPVGGFGWDGRAASAHDQAAGPLLSGFEMANATRADAVARLRRSASAEAFEKTFGPHALDDDERAWTGLLWALEVYQQDPRTFAPFSSKYDAVLRGQAALTPSEQRGLAAFNDPRRGNCASCHPSAAGRGGLPLFTDFGLSNLGLPRNARIAANRDPSFYDLGLGGPLREDLVGDDGMCGRFKTPSLRNVAVRRVFFHNGVFVRLDDAVRFYAQRDRQPERYFGRNPRGQANRPNDQPAPCLASLQRDAPFGRARDQPPALSEAEVRDVVAFLRTLTDGWAPPAAPAPAAR